MRLGRAAPGQPDAVPLLARIKMSVPRPYEAFVAGHDALLIGARAATRGRSERMVPMSTPV